MHVFIWLQPGPTFPQRLVRKASGRIYNGKMSGETHRTPAVAPARQSPAPPPRSSCAAGTSCNLHEEMTVRSLLIATGSLVNRLPCSFL